MDNNKDKGKAIQPYPKKKLIEHQDTLNLKLQKSLNRTIGQDIETGILRRKKKGKIFIVVEGVHNLYDDGVETQGFSPKKVFGLRGVPYHFPNIVTQIKKCVCDVFTNIHKSLDPTTYFLKHIREFYDSHKIWHNQHKYKQSVVDLVWIVFL